jgi:hypothetical protein
MNCRSDRDGKYDTAARLSWFMSRFLVMVFRVPGRAETMTKGDMADVMVCLSNTYARTGAPIGSLKGPTGRMSWFPSLSAKTKQRYSPTAALFSLCFLRRA